MTFVPQLGFITITPAISFTLLHIPVLFAGLLFGWKGGLAYGTLFGVLSFIRALVNPASPIDSLFVNPLISVLPRIIFGLLVGIFLDLSQRISHKVLNKAYLSISSFLLTIIHSVIVLFSLGQFEGPSVLTIFNGAFSSYWAFMSLVILTNGLWEAIIAAILIPILAKALSGNPTVKKLRII
jgi:uncharacterized membrane protein